MALSWNHIRATLAANGFVRSQVPHFLLPNVLEDRFLRPAAGDLSVDVQIDGDGSAVRRLGFGLTLVKRSGEPLIGPIHRVYSDAGLTSGLPTIVAHLDSLAANPTALKCTKCGTRWVALKEPIHGKKFTPFLSCMGMRKVRTTIDGLRVKELACDGVGQGQALFLYP